MMTYKEMQELLNNLLVELKNPFLQKEKLASIQHGYNESKKEIVVLLTDEEKRRLRRVSNKIDKLMIVALQAKKIHQNLDDNRYVLNDKQASLIDNVIDNEKNNQEISSEDTYHVDDSVKNNNDEQHEAHRDVNSQAVSFVDLENAQSVVGKLDETIPSNEGMLSFNEVIDKLDRLHDEIKTVETVQQLQDFITRHQQITHVIFSDKQAYNEFSEKNAIIKILIKKRGLLFDIKSDTSVCARSYIKFKEKAPSKAMILNSAAEKFVTLYETYNNNCYSTDALMEMEKQYKKILSKIHRALRCYHAKDDKHPEPLQEENTTMGINNRLEATTRETNTSINSSTTILSMSSNLSFNTIKEKASDSSSKMDIYYSLSSHIPIFEAKVTSLKTRKCDEKAINAAQAVVDKLYDIEDLTMKTPLTLMTANEELEKLINEAHRTLDIHRGFFKRALLKVLSGVEELFCCASSSKKIANYSFFKTDSAKKLDKLEEDIHRPYTVSNSK